MKNIRNILKLEAHDTCELLPVECRKDKFCIASQLKKRYWVKSKSSKNEISIDILNKKEGLLDNNYFNNFDHELKVIEN